MFLVWLCFRSPHDERAARMMRTSEPPHQRIVVGIVCLSRASSIEVTAHTQKEKISAALFSPSEKLHLQAVRHVRCAELTSRFRLRPAIGDAGCDRLQRGRIAMPA